MRSFFALISLVVSATAYEITSPSNTSGWTSKGPDSVTYTWVNTDSDCLAVLVRNSQFVSILNNITISNTAGETTTPVTVPSSGFQTGDGFQVNFVKDANDLSTILAQSGTFNITASDSTSSSSSVITTTKAKTTSPGSSGSPTTDSNGSSATVSPTTSGKNGADRITAAGSTSLVFAAFVAFIL